MSQDQDQKQKTDLERRRKAIDRLVKRVIRLIPDLNEDSTQSWFLAVPYESQIQLSDRPVDAGVYLLSPPLFRPQDLGRTFEAIAGQCIMSGIPVESLIEGLRRSLERVAKARQPPQPGVVLPGNFNKN